MSDETNQTKPPEHAQPEHAQPEQSGSTRKLILFGVLGVLLVALAYDYRVARAGVESAYDKIIASSEKTNASKTDSLSQQDIQALVGRPPTETFQEGDDLVEVYSWRSGLPIRTYKLYAFYRPQGDGHVFYRHAKYQYESKSDVMAISVPTMVEVDLEAIAEEDAMANPEQGGAGEPGGGAGPGGPGGGSARRAGPGPGGGGSSGAGPGGGNFDPEARFTENDEDGDGVLKEDEIPARMKEHLAEIDTDGDGAVTKEEFLARIAAMRAGAGSGTGRGGRGRPEAESETPPATPPAEETSPAATDQQPAADDPSTEEASADDKTADQAK